MARTLSSYTLVERGACMTAWVGRGELGILIKKNNRRWGGKVKIQTPHAKPQNGKT